MASTKRELPLSDEPEFKKAKVSVLEPSQYAAISNVRVVLNSADCDIDFNVDGDGLQGSALYEEGFAYCWSGARANTGITRGKYCFGCKIVSSQPVDMEDTPLHSQHVCRVGISRGDDAVRNLGETSNSLGFGGTGKFSNSGIFSDYGDKFGVGDTIVCAVDLESWPMASIGFSKNGKWLGIAKLFDAGPSGLGVVGSPQRNLPWESAIFPHILLKNVIVQLQFSIDDGLVPEQGYKPWADAFLDGNTIIGPAFSNENEREVIMMVGLPASGKTTWAEKWVNEHPEKRYVLLGTNLALEQMKVPGLLRKNNYGERFDRLMDRASKIFNVLLSRASKISRNFIIDQTNVYKSARKRKLKPFADYNKIAVVVFPKVEELKSRAGKRFQEMGKEVPAEAVNEMLANYTLPMSKGMPRTDEYFDQVWFVELSREEAQRSLDEMKREVSVKPPYSRENSVTSCSGSSLKHRQKAPVQSNTGESFQNQGLGGHYEKSNAYQPPSGGSYFSSRYTHNPFDPSRSNNAELYSRTSSLSYNTSDVGYANVSEGTTAPSPYDSYSGPPYGSFPNGGAYAKPRPPCVNSPMDVPPPPHGIVPSYMQNVGICASSVNSPMDVPHGNFFSHVQSVFPPPPHPLMRPLPTLPRPLMRPLPPPLHLRPPPPPLTMGAQYSGVYPPPPQGF